MQSPRLGRWLLHRIFNDRLYDEISGDLEEIFNDRLARRGRFFATAGYYKDVLLSVRNIGLRGKEGRRDNAGMMRSLLVIAFRSLKKRAMYSTLNVAGLTMSICSAFLMGLYLFDQFSYDRHFNHSERIYRVNLETNMNGKRDVYCNVPQPLPAALKTSYPQIEETARVALTDHTGTLEHKDKKVPSNKLVIADGSILKIFEREFVYGNPREALSQPASIVVSESIARDLFGRKDVIGELVYFKDFEKELKITGVMADDDRRSHFPMHAIVSWSTFPQYESDEWYGFHTYAYVLLREGTHVSTLAEQMPSFFDRYMKKTFDEFNGTANIHFQPLVDIYLSEPLVWEPNPHGNRTYVIALASVVVFLLVFAIVNYVNLATARAGERASEVGIRKVLGSSSRSLQIQFLGESFMLAIAAGVLSIILAFALLPMFSRFSGVTVEWRDLITPAAIGALMLLTLTIGFLAGIVPAFYLSSLQSLKILKGRFVTGKRGEILRRALVTTQYFFAAVLISGVVIVYEQTRYIKNRDIGFEKENLVNVSVPSDSIVNNHIDVYMKAIETWSEVRSASLAQVKVHGEANSFSPTLQNPDGTKFQSGSDIVWADADFFPTIGAQIVAGRNFDKNITTESETSVIINEAAAKKFGWTENPLAGKFAAFTPYEPYEMNVIGVVKDFHIGVSYRYVHPTIIFLSHGGETSLYVRLAGDDLQSTLDKMRATWSEHFPAFPFEYSMTDMDLASLYEKDEKFLAITGVFCLMTLTIASLGIIGLISYTTQVKRKDIAIRKVLGSTSANIVAILSRKFVYLLVIASALSIPAGSYISTIWLRNFDYHVEITPWPFVIAVSVCFFFTASSILYHTIYAARTNPANALKYE